MLSGEGLGTIFLTSCIKETATFTLLTLFSSNYSVLTNFYIYYLLENLFYSTYLKLTIGKMATKDEIFIANKSINLIKTQ
jgi:hypothetical protein